MIRKPNLFILGAQKSGTTWLHQALNEHPEIYLSEKKEIHFFNTKSNFIKGFDYYLNHFSSAKSEKYIGESTPNYLWVSNYKPEYLNRGCNPKFMSAIPKRIKKFLGEDLKFIVLLRDPVERAISAFYHHLKFDNRIDLNKPFEESIKDFGIAQMGFYAEHLKTYFKHFDSKKFIVFNYEEFFENPKIGLNKTLTFLSLPNSFDFSILNRSIHSSKKKMKINGEYYISISDNQVRKVVSKENIEFLKDLYKKETKKLDELLMK